MKPHACEHPVESVNESVKTDVGQKGGQGCFVQIVLKVVNVYTSFERKGDENKNGNGKHYDPGLVFKQVGQILLYACLLLRRRQDALLGGQESDDKEYNTYSGKYAHNVLETHCPIAFSKNENQGE